MRWKVLNERKFFYEILIFVSAFIVTILFIIINQSIVARIFTYSDILLTFLITWVFLRRIIPIIFEEESEKPE